MTDEDVAEDSEVQNFMNELSRDGERKPDGGNGQVNSFQKLMRVLNHREWKKFMLPNA